jgi:hypothetical protein
MRRLQKFLRLSPGDQLRLAGTFLLLGSITLGLRTLSWRTLQSWLLALAKRFPRRASSSRPSPDEIGWAIRVASRRVPGATCLPRALAAQFLLVANAYPAEVHLGVAKDSAGKLKAHAWATSEGEVVMGRLRGSDHYIQLSPLSVHTPEDYDPAI